MIALAVVAPFAAALLAYAVRDTAARRTVRIVLAIAAAVCALGAAGSVDVLSRIFLVIVSSLGLLATIVSAGSFSVDWVTGEAIWSRKPVYFLLLGAFWSAMLLVVLAGNFATLWLGISATTLVTAFLVGFGAERSALEAAWKYLVLCSVGIGFALLGIIMLAHVSLAIGLPPASALSWDAIVAHAPAVAPPLARLATAVMLIGFATKAGLVPMHAWLPDAHSKAPAPISALLSGVLVSCALYAIVRTVDVAGALGAGTLVHTILLALGAASTIVAGSLMLAQRDLKRLLAYSTVEHAGIVALALGFGGPIGTFAALFHVVSHAFAKSGAFFAAGMVQHERRSTNLGVLRGLWRSGPGGRCLLAALTALAGLPPFGLFVSELLLILAGVAAHQWLALGVGLAGIALAFAALSRAAIELESGTALVRPNAAQVARRTSRLAFSATGITLAAALILAVTPWTPMLSRAYAAAVSASSGAR
jgi:hydrogenase-4 component F